MAQSGTHARPKSRRASRLPLLLLLVTFLAVGGVLIYFAVWAAIGNGMLVEAKGQNTPFGVIKSAVGAVDLGKIDALQRPAKS